MGNAWHKKISSYFFCIFMFLFLTSALPTNTMATDLPKEQFQKTLQDSLKALWTGEKFSPELVKRQNAMKEMIKTGAVQKAELDDMMKKEMPTILSNSKTTYYLLQEMPAAFDDLFSPLMDWNRFKEDFCWGVTTASLKQNTPDPYVIKFGTLAPEGTPWLAVPEKVLVPRIEGLANGTLKLKFYTGGIMGEDPDVLRKMDIGQLDGCGCTAFGVLEASPEASVFMVPNLFRNYQEVDYVYKKLRKLLDQSFAQKGYTCSAIIDTGFEYMFLKNKISGFDDLKKQKVLTSMGNIESTLLEELGISSIPVAIPELVSALSTGIGDAFISPAAWALGMQAYQYVNFYIPTPFFYAPGVVLTSKSMKSRVGKYFGVSETLVDNVIELIILEISLVEKEWKEQARNYEGKSLKAFEAKCGIKPITLSPKDQKAFEEAALRVQEKLAGKDYPRDLLNEVLKALEEYRKTDSGGTSK